MGVSQQTGGLKPFQAGYTFGNCQRPGSSSEDDPGMSQATLESRSIIPKRILECNEIIGNVLSLLAEE